jgi:hypothetical protein
VRLPFAYTFSRPMFGLIWFFNGACIVQFQFFSSPTCKLSKLLFGLIWFFNGANIVQFQFCSMNHVCGKFLENTFLLRLVRVVAWLDWHVTNFTICCQLASLSESNWKEPLATWLTYLLKNWWWNFMQTSWEYCDPWNYKPLETIFCI